MYIRNVMVRITDSEVAQFLVQGGAAIVDVDGVYTTTAHWLSGKNPWGLHQDQFFAHPISRVRQGMRIIAAAEHAIEQEATNILLNDSDHAAILRSLQQPKRHPAEIPIPAKVARAVLPIMDSIEHRELLVPSEPDEATDPPSTDSEREAAEPSTDSESGEAAEPSTDSEPGEAAEPSTDSAEPEGGVDSSCQTT